MRAAGPADTPSVAGTWTYRRDGESLEIRRYDRDDGVDLILSTPRRSETRTFTHMEGLLVYHALLERSLLQAGWSLGDYYPDRRTGGERRQTSRGPDRRGRTRVLLFARNDLTDGRRI